ncbi:MAG: SCO family protein [Candidatus Lambdaproteobacteria bacterium]|nr:SCO family protein [Candidatus Lambdaproteobacteria bacterium]
MAKSSPGANLSLLMLLLWLAATMSWWGLAFAPQGGTAPVWLARLQSVCFGTQANGLPAPYGWGALIAGPLGMLALLWLGWTQELLAGLRALGRRPLGMGLMWLVALALVLETGWVAMRLGQGLLGAGGPQVNQSIAPLPAGYPRLERPAPDFVLVDQHGAKLSLAHLRGRPAIVSFGFGHCETVCPLVLRTVARSAKELAATVNPALVVITMDPWRDTPSALEGLRRNWELPERTLMLSGDVERVNRVLDQFGVARRRDERTGVIDHVPLVFVLDRDLRIVYALNNPPVSWIVEAVRRADGAGS